MEAITEIAGCLHHHVPQLQVSAWIENISDGNTELERPITSGAIDIKHNQCSEIEMHRTEIKCFFT